MSEAQIRAIVRDELALLGDSALPGGLNAIPGLEPDYETQAVRAPQTLVRDVSQVDYGQSPAADETQLTLNANESRGFTLFLHNAADDAPGSQKAYGLAIQVPGTPTRFSAVAIGPTPGGGGSMGGLTMRHIGLNDINGNSMGRFGSGTIAVFGHIENGTQPGLLKLAYGAPEALDQMGQTAAEVTTGNETITLPLPGDYVLECTVEFDVDIDPADTTATNPYATIVPDSGDPSFCILKAGAPGTGLPAWFILTDEGGGTHDVEVDATILKMLLQGLQTSDPGGGLVWLSAT